MPILAYLLVGLVGGVVSGALGIGGGTIMVPVFALIFGLTQHQAQGTALAVMLPPVFILAVWRYWAAGHVQVKMALVIAVAFTCGALIGASIVQHVPDAMLRRVFAVFLILVGFKMFLGK